MKTLQRLLIIALCLMIPSSAGSWGPVMMSGGVASVPAGDYVVATGKIKCGATDYGPHNMKVVIYSAAGTKLATSNAVQWAASSWVTATFTGGPTLTPGTNYIIALVNDGNNSVFTDGVDYSSYMVSGAGYYATPPASITPPASDGDDGSKIGLYVANAAGTKLVGDDTNYTTNEEIKATNEMYFLETLQACVTL